MRPAGFPHGTWAGGGGGGDGWTGGGGGGVDGEIITVLWPDRRTGTLELRSRFSFLSNLFLT